MFGISLDLFFYYSILCILVGCLYAYSLYKKGKGISSRRIFWILFLARSFLISILIFLLLSPIIKSTFYTVEKPIVIIGKDNSESIKDSISTDLKDLKESLIGFDVYTYSFSDNIYENLSDQNVGLKTNYSDFLLAIKSNFENKNVAGVVIASDGCYNTGQNPEFIKYDFPVYSIALGDTNIYKDIGVNNILSNDISFLGNTFPLEISITSNVFKSETARLTIWNEKVKVYEQVLAFLPEKDFEKIYVKLNSEKVGLNTYTVKIDALEGENNLQNNTYLVYVDVIDYKSNILIIKEDNHPDIAAYKSVLDKNKNYKVDVRNVDDDFNVENYQLVVLFGVEKTPQYLMSSTVPLIIFNANQSHYRDFGSLVAFSIRSGYDDLLAARNNEFQKFTFSQGLLEFIKLAPPLKRVFGVFSLDKQVEVVLKKKKGENISNNPIIMIQEINGRKVSFVPTEGWWRWRLYDYSINQSHDSFDELFSKLSQYLVLEDTKDLFRVSYKRQYDESSDIIINAELYNESYELINDKEIELIISDINGVEYVFQFSKSEEKYLVNAGQMDVGSYNFMAKVEGTSLNSQGSFDIRKIQLEQLSLVANHNLLKKIASISGGKVFYQDNIKLLLKELNNSASNKNIIHVKEKQQNLINISWILLVLLLIISLEWFMRKYHGLI